MSFMESLSISNGGFIEDENDDDDLDILSNAKKYASTSVVGHKRPASNIHSSQYHPTRKVQKTSHHQSDVHQNDWSYLDGKSREKQEKQERRERMIKELTPGTPVFAYFIAKCKLMWHSFMNKYISPFLKDHDCLNSVSDNKDNNKARKIPASAKSSYVKTSCQQRRLRMRIYIDDNRAGEESVLSSFKNACVCLFDYHSGVHICSHQDNPLFHSSLPTSSQYLYFENDNIHFCSITGRGYICGDLCRFAHQNADRSTQYQATCPLTGTVISGDSVMVSSKLWRNWNKVCSQTSTSKHQQHNGSKLVPAGNLNEYMDYDPSIDDVALYCKMAYTNVKSNATVAVVSTEANSTKPLSNKKGRSTTTSSGSTNAKGPANFIQPCNEELAKFIDARNSSTYVSSSLQFKPLWVNWDKKYPMWKTWVEEMLQMRTYSDVVAHLRDLESINYLYVCESKELLTRYSVILVFSLFCEERYIEEKNYKWRHLLDIANRELHHTEQLGGSGNGRYSLLGAAADSFDDENKSVSSKPQTTPSKDNSNSNVVVYSDIFNRIITGREKERNREEASSALIIREAHTSLLYSETNQMIALGSKPQSNALALSTSNVNIARSLRDIIIYYGRRYFLIWTEVCRLSWEITRMQQKLAARNATTSSSSSPSPAPSSLPPSFSIPLLFFVYAMLRKAPAGIMYSSIDSFADCDDFAGCYILAPDQRLASLLPANWKCISESLYDRHSVSRVYDSAIKIITTAVSMDIIRHDHFLLLDNTWEEMRVNLSTDPWFSPYKYKKLLRGPVASTKKRAKPTTNASATVVVN